MSSALRRGPEAQNQLCSFIAAVARLKWLYIAAPMPTLRARDMFVGVLGCSVRNARGPATMALAHAPRPPFFYGAHFRLSAQNRCLPELQAVLSASPCPNTVAWVVGGPPGACGRGDTDVKVPLHVLSIEKGFGSSKSAM